MESLYRKYRPLTFESVVGQQHIVSTLEHAVTEGRLGHAYLFCGPRGTGKTTMARILAKALLCEHAAAARAEGASGCLPDGTCSECEQIAEGTHPDVYELDAASRTGVDNVREEIIGSVNFAPVRGAFKIYIIDEVHMLTTAAFNALLKTLEEPPSHVVFVLCTTDPQKIPETILSRCQRFDFHRIGNEDIVGRLRYICEQEGFEYDDEALEIVAKHARGGMRDALSTLEQLSVFGNGAVHEADARALLGEVSGTVLSEFCRAIAARDVPALFGLVRAQVDAGEDLMELTRDLVAHVRDVYMARVAGARAELFEGTPEEVAALGEEAGLFESGDRLARVLTVLDDAALEMRNAADTRLVLEIALTRLARPESDLTLEALAERVARLEAQIAAGVPSAPLDAAGAAAMMGAHGATLADAAAPPREVPAAGGAPGSSNAPAAHGAFGQATAHRSPADSGLNGRAAAAPETVTPEPLASVQGADPAAMSAVLRAAEASRGDAAVSSAGSGRPAVSTPSDAARARTGHSPAPVAGVSPAHMDRAASGDERMAPMGAASAPAGADAGSVEHAMADAAQPSHDAGGASDERMAADGAHDASGDASGQEAAPTASARPASAAEVAAASAAPTPAVTDEGELQRKWREAVKRVVAAQPSRGALLQSSRAGSDDGTTLTIHFPAGSNFAITMLGRPDTQSVVLPQVTAVFGARTVRYVMDGSPAGASAAASKEPAGMNRSQAAEAAPAVQTASSPAGAPAPIGAETVPVPAAAPADPAAPMPAAPVPAAAAAPSADSPATAPASAVAAAAPGSAPTAPAPVPASVAESARAPREPIPAASAGAHHAPDEPEATAATPAAAPAPQPASAPVQADPAPAQPGAAPVQPEPAPAQPEPAPEPLQPEPAPAAADLPPWDDDQVPYDDLSATPYDDEVFPPFDMPADESAVAPMPAHEAPAAPEPTAPPAAENPAPAPSPASPFAAEPSAPAFGFAPAPAAPATAPAAPTADAPTDGAPIDSSDVASVLTGIFGDGVTVTEVDTPL